MSVQLAVLAAALLGAPAANPAQVALVGRLYLEREAPARIGRLFAHDLARAYHRDMRRRGEVGAIDFDWRYGAQDFRIKEVRIEASRLAPSAMPTKDSALVRASFRNFGKPGEVEYRLCRRPNGQWRIADVSSKAGRDSWSLRELLHLDPERIRC